MDSHEPQTVMDIRPLPKNLECRPRTWMDLGPSWTSDHGAQARDEFKTGWPQSNPVKTCTHMPRNIWQVAKIDIAHIDHWRLCYWWLLQPAWGRQSRCFAPSKLPQSIGSSGVSVVLLGDHGRYGPQLACPVRCHVVRLHYVGSPMHSVTPALWQDHHRRLLQLLVTHVRLDATKDIIRMVCTTRNPATSDLCKLIGVQVAPPLE